jgi:hypothetical protein
MDCIFNAAIRMVKVSLDLGVGLTAVLRHIEPSLGPQCRSETASIYKKNTTLPFFVLLVSLVLAVDLTAATHSGDWLDPVVSLPPSVPRVERPIIFPPGVVDVQEKGLDASKLSVSIHASIAEEEADPKLRRLHVCVNSGEAYSASWLVTAKYLAASKHSFAYIVSSCLVLIIHALSESQVEWTLST